MAHPIESERAPSRLCARNGVEAGGFLSVTIATTDPPTSYAVSCDPRLSLKVSLHRGPSIVSSCETPRHSTNVMVPFSSAPLKLTIALFIGVLSWVRRSCRSFFPRYVWRARESSDWTRGTTPTHTPPTPRLAWLSSISQSGWIVLAVQHPPSPPRPTPASASTSRVPISLPWGSSSAARAAHELSTASYFWLLLASVATVLSSSISTDAMGCSGSRSRRNGRFPRAEVATTRPRTRAWQLIYTAPLMELLLVSPRPPSRIGR